MIDSLIMLASGAPGKPLFSSPAIDSFKDVVNFWSQPQYSLPLFTILFVLMLVFYRKWSRPIPAGLILVGFSAIYFGSMAIDSNYSLILTKADNVPITIMLFGVGICLWTAFREAATNDKAIEEGKPIPYSDRDDKVLVWPDLVYIELICLVLASAALLFWSVGLPAPLEAPANPAGPPNPSKAPWYFLGLQEMLVYFDPWMAGVILPGMIVSGLIAMPYIDTNPKGNGYYTFKERPFAITTWLFGFIILWVVLIVFGTFLRGPNWNFFGPYEYWDALIQVPLTNINLSDYFWLYLFKSELPTNPFVREGIGIVLSGAWVLAFLTVPWWPLMVDNIPGIGKVSGFARKLFGQMGTIRFLILAFHLAIMAMMPLKMVLRWLFTLKYFIYLPEFNMNL